MERDLLLLYSLPSLIGFPNAPFLPTLDTPQLSFHILSNHILHGSSLKIGNQMEQKWYRHFTVAPACCLEGGKGSYLSAWLLLPKFAEWKSKELGLVLTAGPATCRKRFHLAEPNSVSSCRTWDNNLNHTGYIGMECLLARCPRRIQIHDHLPGWRFWLQVLTLCWRLVLWIAV